MSPYDFTQEEKKRVDGLLFLLFLIMWAVPGASTAWVIGTAVVWFLLRD